MFNPSRFCTYSPRAGATPAEISLITASVVAASVGVAASRHIGRTADTSCRSESCKSGIDATANLATSVHALPKADCLRSAFFTSRFSDMRIPSAEAGLSDTNPKYDGGIEASADTICAYVRICSKNGCIPYAVNCPTCGTSPVFGSASTARIFPAIASHAPRGLPFSSKKNDSGAPIMYRCGTA